MSTYALCAKVTFPAHEGRQKFMIRRINECRINRSWQGLTDTAEITIPRKVKDFNRMKIGEWFRPGDPVIIELGYDGNYHVEFTGYVKATPAGIPLVISCEDEMYKLKRKVISVSLSNCTLKELLQTIAPGYKIVCDETKLMGSFRFAKLTQAQCLEELKRQGIACYFDDKVLHAMDTKSRIDGTIHDIQIEKTAGYNLEVKEIQKTKVKIELTRKIGKKFVVEYGDENAALFLKRSYSGIAMSKAEMREEAKGIYARAKMPGLDGDISLFGIPQVKLGDSLKLHSSFYKNAPEYNKAYSVDSITKAFSPQGFRQVCKLGDLKI
ncbi:MAG: hypothetical protein N4A71_02455 [Carboxylicivirga sp.]|nr:hypothetical protein [Carboxylicivirga sp.]